MNCDILENNRRDHRTNELNFITSLYQYKQLINDPTREIWVSLGVMIDETLTWRSQVDLITKKVNKSLYVLRRLREFTDLKQLLHNIKL